MTPRLLTFAVGICASATSYASEQIKFDIGAYLWQTQYSGTFTIIDYEPAPGDSLTILQPTDVQDDLNMGKETQYSFYFSIEHNTPALPNLRFAHTAMQAESSSTLTKDILFNGFIFRFDDTVESEVDLSHTDLSAYYSVLDKQVSIDLGITLRLFDGFAQMRQPEMGAAGISRIDINELVPLAYGNLEIVLPLKGLSLDASLHFVNYDSNEVIDFSSAINYRTKLGLGASLGYRSVSTDLKDLEGQAVDLKADGPYAGLSYHF